MRLFIALAAASIAFAATTDVAEAQSRKKNRDLIVKVKPRSFLDAGTQVQPGSRHLYATGMTPFRGSDSTIPTGSHQSRLLPGAFGIAW
jgi:hypothetical protein